MALSFVIVDVFTDTPLAGNQLGVFPDGRDLSTEQMLSLTRELNFSESTFILPPERGGTARVRIFTPGQEMPFAGHPTLGTAYVLSTTFGLDEVQLETLRGTIPVRFDRAGDRPNFGRMEQPIPTVEPFDRPDQLLAALGVDRSELPVELYDNGVRHVYVALGSEEEVASLRPNLVQLAALGDVGFNCFAGAGKRWKTRMFAPEFGVGEDPATGSAAGPLALHLARHSRIAWGDEIEIQQGVEIRRPSTLFGRVQGIDGQVERVEVAGSAVIVARGEFIV